MCWMNSLATGAGTNGTRRQKQESPHPAEIIISPSSFVSGLITELQASRPVWEKAMARLESGVGQQTSRDDGNLLMGKGSGRVPRSATRRSPKPLQQIPGGIQERAPWSRDGTKLHPASCGSEEPHLGTRALTPTGTSCPWFYASAGGSRGAPIQVDFIVRLAVNRSYLQERRKPLATGEDKPLKSRTSEPRPTASGEGRRTPPPPTAWKEPHEERA